MRILSQSVLLTAELYCTDHQVYGRCSTLANSIIRCSRLPWRYECRLLKWRDCTEKSQKGYPSSMSFSCYQLAARRKPTFRQAEQSRLHIALDCPASRDIYHRPFEARFGELESCFQNIPGSRLIHHMNAILTGFHRGVMTSRDIILELRGNWIRSG
jgi:hypothetical protein